MKCQMSARLSWLFVLAGLAAVACSSSNESGQAGPNAGPDAGADTGPVPPTEAGVSACPKATGGPTEHQGTITADETWTADKSPHIIVNDTQISAKLTIEPCAEVLLGERSSV